MRQFQVPPNVKKAAKDALGSHDLCKVDTGTFLVCKALAESNSANGDVIKRGLKWWKQNKKDSDFSQLYGGAEAKAWFNACYKELEELEKRKSLEDSRHEINYKDELLSIKDIDEAEGVVTGYFAHFNNKDSVGDIIKQGAFGETIADWGPQGKRRIKHLFNHNPSALIGIPTLLKEDEEGLYYESKISKTSLGKDMLRLVADGVITEHSIGYSTLGYEFDDDDDTVVYLTKIRLYEGSFVTWGANEMTPVTGMKGLVPLNALQNETDPVKLLVGLKGIVDNAEKSLRKGTWETEDVPTMVELTLKTMRPLIKHLGNALGEFQTKEVSSEEIEVKKTLPKDEPKSSVPSEAPGVKALIESLERDLSDFDAKAETSEEDEILKGIMESLDKDFDF